MYVLLLYIPLIVCSGSDDALYNRSLFSPMINYGHNLRFAGRTLYWSLEELLHAFYNLILFSSIINYALSLNHAGKAPASPFTINYKNFLVSFIFAVVFFVPFGLEALGDIPSFLDSFLAKTLFIVPAFTCIVYCLITKKTNLLLNFALLEIFSVAVYSLLLFILLNAHFIGNEYRDAMSAGTVLNGFLRFSSIINSLLSLMSARRTSESSFAINHKNVIISSTFAIVFFILFVLVNKHFHYGLRV
jgi:hypothetical protein